MSRIIAVPNWSLHDPVLPELVASLFEKKPIKIHYALSDVDHQRAVIGFSGETQDVFDGMTHLCRSLLDRIDLSSSHGVHPRAGALDVAPFVCLDDHDHDSVIDLSRKWASTLWSEFSIPSYLYEKSAYAGRETRLPVLRGQIGTRPNKFDFGFLDHPKWGYSVVGVRGFLLAVNLNFNSISLEQTKHIARLIRQEREAQNPIYLGIRALGFALQSRRLTQLSMNFTSPDKTSFDVVFQDICARWGEPLETELIGVIRRTDADNARFLSISPAQIVD